MKHFDVSYSWREEDYKGSGFGSTILPVRGADHVDKILELYRAVIAHDEEALQDADVVQTREGYYIKLQNAANYDLALKSIDSIKIGHIVSVNETMTDAGVVTSVILFLKKEKKDWLNKKAESYKGSKRTKKGERINKPLLESIDNIASVSIDDLWCGKGQLPCEEKEWVELWFIANDAEPILEILSQLNIEHKQQSLKFPERIVVIVYANHKELESLFFASDTLVRVSQVPTLAGFIAEEQGPEQRDWMKMIMDSFRFDQISDKYFCLLDSGVVAGHPMLLPVLSDSDRYVVKTEWGINDARQHGTRMAGIVVYGDLTDVLGNGPIIEPHNRLCSVKVLPNEGISLKDFWADYTKQAVALAEIIHGNDVMGYCMAIAEINGYTVGVPSSWSGAIDQICNDTDGTRRFFIQCAGNIDDDWDFDHYPESNKSKGVVNPGQAWNALTVGAYTEKCEAFDEHDNQLTVVAQKGGLSPYSSTSANWEQQTPIKPEVVMEGGNRYKSTSGTSSHRDLELLTTSNSHKVGRPFGLINATSAATAMAAHYASLVSVVNPNYWPETVRGLFVHTAQWTEQMIQDFPDKDERLRTCGYGVPDLKKMLESRKNGVTFIAQQTMQPYKKGAKRNSFNKMHIYTLPWPKQTLLELGERNVRLTITLSYFIEPGPTDNYVSSFKKYNYASAGLRFELSNVGETARQFKNRIVHNYDEDDVRTVNDTQRWNIGIRKRTKGSVHKDWVEMSAADLATCNMIAVFPVSGWWYYRHSLDKIESEMRYSLIVSLETDEEQVDFTAEISNQISIENQSIIEV